MDAGKNYLAKANSVWALIDLQTGKPVRVAEEHVARYKMEEKLDMEYGPRKLKLPQNCVKREPFTYAAITWIRTIMSTTDSISGWRRNIFRRALKPDICR